MHGRAPDPIQADTQTGDRTYRVARGNNQPDDILAYDWPAIFSAAIAFNGKALDNDVDLAFPVRITATTLSVKQAVGGIITLSFSFTDDDGATFTKTVDVQVAP